MVITGDIGIGKTTIVNRVIDEIQTDVVLARLTHTTVSPVELLQAILLEFGIPEFKNKKILLLHKLSCFLREQKTLNKHSVIIVDEAQNLTAETLEELRLLSCIDANDDQLVTIILVGQPDLNSLIDSQKMRNLSQRTRLRQHLACLTMAETAEYIGHRVSIVSLNGPKLFDDDSVEKIHVLSGGIPRLINTLCDTALMACYLSGKQCVDTSHIESVIEELNWVKVPDNSPPHLSEPGAAWLFVYRDGFYLNKSPISSFPFILGRDPDANLPLPASTVSRKHLLIGDGEYGYFAENLSASNGTLINKQILNSHSLSPGDVLEVYPFEIVFHSY